MREDSDCALIYLAIRLGRDNTLVCSLQERNRLSTSDNKETMGVAALGQGAITVKLSIFFLFLKSSRWSKTTTTFLRRIGWVCSMGRDKFRLSEANVSHQVTYLASNRFLNLYFRTLLSKSTDKKQDVLQLQQRVKCL